MNRDESIAKMKQQLDEWNAKIGDWEGQMHETQTTIKARYENQLETLRQQREEGISKLKQAQESSEAAWRDMSSGFEEAWKHLAEGFENAWSEFGSKKHKDDTKG
jgi:oligoendopeptidase F